MKNDARVRVLGLVFEALEALERRPKNTILTRQKARTYARRAESMHFKEGFIVGQLNPCIFTWEERTDYRITPLKCRG